MERRNFIKLFGGTTAGLALSQCTTRKGAPSNAVIPDEWRAGVEQWVPSTCLQCPGGCGLLARIVDGNAVKLEGNPLHPVNAGRLCPAGQAGLQALYSPDRLRGPMIRTGKKGAGDWRRVSWAEAIQAVAGRLRELRAQGAAHSLAIGDGYGIGLMRDLLQRFAQAFGSPNYFGHNRSDGMASAYYFTQGVREPMGYDLENARYILSFGCDLFGQWRSPVWAQRVYGYWRQERPGAKAKIVQVDPRLSLTASRSDEWIPVHPGSQGALALAIAYVIIREELYDLNFLNQHTFGFEDWTDADGRRRIGFKTLIGKEYRPDEVSSLTGVPVDTIIRLAKEFAAQRPALALGGPEATMGGNGTYNAMAIHALNALVGSIGAPGGFFIQSEMPFHTPPPPTRDAIAEKGVAMPRMGGDEPFPCAVPAWGAIAEAILSQNPYPLNALFLYYTNPLASSPHRERLARALEKVPFVVSFSPFLDESAEYADLILPDHTYLERWQDAPAAPTSGAAVLGIAQPVVKPLYDTQHTGDVLLAVAREIGGALSEALPWKDFKALLMESAQGLFQSARGSVFTDPLEAEHVRQLAKRGWRIPTHHSFEAFWGDLLSQGGWWEPGDALEEWGKLFRTPSGKFEFYSQSFAAAVGAWTKSQAARTDGPRAPDVWPDEDRTYLPHYEAESATADKAAYPFYLNVFRPEVFAGGGRAHQPWLQEIAGPHVHMVWQPWAEINPHTAQQLGLSDGDWICVESPAGRLKVKAKLYPGAMPDVINIPYGLGHDASDRVDRGRAANPLQLVHAPADRISGLPSVFATRVRIYKDSGPPEAQRLPSVAGLEPGRGRDSSGGMVMEKRYG